MWVIFLLRTTMEGIIKHEEKEANKKKNKEKKRKGKKDAGQKHVHWATPLEGEHRRI